MDASPTPNPTPTLCFEDWDRDSRYLKLRKAITKAVANYQLIEAHDKVMVGVSGGKDSAVLYAVLLDIQRRSPYPFQVEPVLLDQKQPGFQLAAFKNWTESLGRPLQVIEQDTYSIVKEKTAPGKTYCGLCSRLRRGILYKYALTHGFTKIALGHHRDDINVTLLLNAFYNGSLSSMPPKLYADDGKNIVIRPLVFVPEKDTKYFAEASRKPLFCYFKMVSLVDCSQRYLLQVTLITIKVVKSKAQIYAQMLLVPHIDSALKNSAEKIR